MKKVNAAGFLFLEYGKSIIGVLAIVCFALPAFAADFTQSGSKTMKFGVKLYTLTDISPKNTMDVSYGQPCGNKRLKSGILSGLGRDTAENNQVYPLNNGGNKMSVQGFPKKLHQFMGFWLRYLHLDDTSAWVDPKMRINTQEQVAVGDGNIVLEIQAGPADLSGVVLYSLKI